VVVAFFGDGALDEGVFFESVNFAVLKNLPILFVCENNRYAIHSKVSDRRKQTELFRVGEGLGLRGRRLDGNDVLVVDEAVSEAVEDIRGGRPPEMLEFMTYRWHEHVGLGVDYQEAYRVPGEEREARGSDPVARARDALLTRFHVGPERLELLETQLRGEIEDAVQFAEMSPYPEPSRLCEDLFAPLR
jgi:TPP-dependent pyruvate/acetoin dehydrogenase alpha subunit